MPYLQHSFYACSALLTLWQQQVCPVVKSLLPSFQHYDEEILYSSWISLK